MDGTDNMSPHDIDAQKILQESQAFEKALRESRSGCAWPSRLLALERLSGISSRA